jgi:hypothetical protein
MTHDDLQAKAMKVLDEAWQEVRKVQETEVADGEDELVLSTVESEEIRGHVSALVNSRTKSYRYAVVTQVLAKAADSTLDACAAQRGDDSDETAFDARSLCAKVVVPFDQDTEKVLGNSADPYVNNPLRVPRLDESALPNQRNGEDFKKLVAVLDFVQENPDEAPLVLNEVLLQVYLRLASTRVEYPTPARVSLGQAKAVLGAFLSASSGGDRMEAVITALFRSFGLRFGAFDRVERRHVNAADQGSGNVLDIDCYQGETIVVAVEAKDRRLKLLDLESGIIPKVKRDKVRESYGISLGLEPAEADAITARVEATFAGGHNIYLFEFNQFADPVLALLGEEGRSVFLEQVGEALDQFSTVQHRQAWAEELKQL